ncbi:Uncharacterized protein PECH_000948 [Penicillium ucsense]|uniref:Yeast cell wall synthesis Kre9/Knh1-like N-terminal domain-containing protein n=1 Tax=Penicillium ucsense TaxID=2839758 RepID=A0A8J8WDC0_9EURO|nr:Uncharacterized protein PECM_003192 [Penicillium ucsense]KAF7733218.1 Uncharacterized protein PECH_000948 [Penicillium ucsense]
MRFSVTTLVAAFAAVASAYTTPDYSKPPQGNPVRSPSLNQLVPEGKPFTIKWDATLGKTVSIVLLRGPSNNVQPLETLAESIPNTGSYMWTPSTSLTPDVTHYGLLIVVEDAGAHHGAYQWSTQFGISGVDGATTAAVTTSKVSQTVTSTSSLTHTIIATTSSVQTTVESATSAVSGSDTAVVVVPTTTTAAFATTQVWVPTGATTLASSTAVAPSGAASSSVTVTPSPTPAYNAAGRTVISFGAVVAGLVAFMAL